MTTQSDLKKLAEQMAGSMNSFDDIKDFRGFPKNCVTTIQLMEILTQSLGKPQQKGRNIITQN